MFSTVNQDLNYCYGKLVKSDNGASMLFYYIVLRYLSLMPIVKHYSSLSFFLKKKHCRSGGLTSFPDYLVLHMRKFVMEVGWVPKKLGMFSWLPKFLLH